METEQMRLPEVASSGNEAPPDTLWVTAKPAKQVAQIRGSRTIGDANLNLTSVSFPLVQ
jgi:hypothetical protein